MGQQGISNLQQEEAQKFSSSQDEPFIEVSATAVSPSTSSDSPTKDRESQLEATVKQLREALEKAQQKEIALLEEINDLKSSLSGQKELVERFQKELNEAKQAATHLALANSKLTEQLTEQLNPPKQQSVNLSKQVSVNPNPPTQKKESIQLTKSHRKSYSTPIILPENKQDADTNTQMWLLD